MKIAFTLVYNLVVIFNSIELSLQSGQTGSSGIPSEPSSFIGPRSRSPSTEIETPASLQKRLENFHLSSKSGQGVPSSSVGPQSQSSFPENDIPVSLRKSLEWKKFIFPENAHLLYFGKISVKRGYTIHTENTFLPVRSIQHDIQVNEFGDVFGFKLHPKSFAIERLYSSPYTMATINIHGDKPVRLLTAQEIEYLKINPNGYKPVTLLSVEEKIHLNQNPNGYKPKNQSMTSRRVKNVWKIKESHT